MHPGLEVKGLSYGPTKHRTALKKINCTVYRRLHSQLRRDAPLRKVYFHGATFFAALSGATFAEFCSTARRGSARHGAAFSGATFAEFCSTQRLVWP